MPNECPYISFATDDALYKLQFEDNSVAGQRSTSFAPCRIVAGDIDPNNPAACGIIACDSTDDASGHPCIVLTTVVDDRMRFACSESDKTVTFVNDHCRFICQFFNPLDFLELVRVVTVAKTAIAACEEENVRQLDLIYAYQFALPPISPVASPASPINARAPATGTTAVSTSASEDHDIPRFTSSTRPGSHASAPNASASRPGHDGSTARRASLVDAAVQTHTTATSPVAITSSTAALSNDSVNVPGAFPADTVASVRTSDGDTNARGPDLTASRLQTRTYDDFYRSG
ncbi:hypothetical protein OH77DRAFT_1517327 [Trametes cingulata]|nr:hypothetical protein OH77DRAFT_1517327 [Trametes cingulata]